LTSPLGAAIMSDNLARFILPRELVNNLAGFARQIRKT
jgi:hypothetical protein